MKIEPIQPYSRRDIGSRPQDTLRSLQELCRDAGADGCAVIDCGDLVFSGGTAAGMEIPPEDKSIFWPVPRFPRDSIEEALRQYRLALAFRLDIGEGDERIAAMKRVYEIAGRLESACFYGGHYLAIGLAAGNCKDIFCGGERRCQALTVGRPCLYPLRSRPSVEACGLDREAIVAAAGWGDLVPDTFLLGMVFVA